MNEMQNAKERTFRGGRIAAWIAALFTVVALYMPLYFVPIAIIFIGIALWFSYPSIRNVEKRTGRTRPNSWWISLSAVSVVALVVQMMLITMYAPPFADYVDPQPMSSFHELIVDNRTVVYLTVGIIAIVSTVASAIVLRRVQNSAANARVDSSVAIGR